MVGLDSKHEDFERQEAADDLEKRFKEEFRGPENAGKVWFTPGGVTLAQVAINYRELQADELAKSLRSYVRHVYNVPPELLGDTTSSNRSTSEAAKYHLAEYSVNSSAAAARRRESSPEHRRPTTRRSTAASRCSDAASPYLTRRNGARAKRTSLLARLRRRLR